MKLYQNPSNTCIALFDRKIYYKLIILETNKMPKAKNGTFQCEQRECLLKNFGNDFSDFLKKI